MVSFSVGHLRRQSKKTEVSANEPKLEPVPCNPISYVWLVWLQGEYLHTKQLGSSDLSPKPRFRFIKWFSFYCICCLYQKYTGTHQSQSSGIYDNCKTTPCYKHHKWVAACSSHSLKEKAESPGWNLKSLFNLHSLTGVEKYPFFLLCLCC